MKVVGTMDDACRYNDRFFFNAMQAHSMQRKLYKVFHLKYRIYFFEYVIVLAFLLHELLMIIRFMLNRNPIIAPCSFLLIRKINNIYVPIVDLLGDPEVTANIRFMLNSFWIYCLSSTKKKELNQITFVRPKKTVRLN